MDNDFNECWSSIMRTVAPIESEWFLNNIHWSNSYANWEQITVLDWKLPGRLCVKRIIVV